MARRLLGNFVNEEGRRYNLFYRLGYGHYKEFVYIGNSTYGNFFRFHVNDFETIFLMWKRYGKNKNGWGHLIPLRGNLQLYIPKSDDDLTRILEMILKPRKLRVVNLRFKSRESLCEGLWKELVVERLEGNAKKQR